MDDDNRDLAFNYKLRSYDIGTENRECREVIRIDSQKAAKGGGSNAPSTLTLADNDDAGQAWTAQETEINGARKKEIDTPVGELLPESSLPNHSQTSKKFANFDPVPHPIVEMSPKTFKVVRNFTDTNASFDILMDQRERPSSGMTIGQPAPMRAWFLTQGGSRRICWKPRRRRRRRRAIVEKSG